MKLMIEIDEARFKDIQRIAEVQLESNHFQTAEQIIASGSDVLDKIRAEIEQITDTMGVSYNQYVSKIDVLQIIDKYTAERSEE